MLAQVAKLLLAACLLTSCADAPSPAADSGAATNPGAPRWSIEPRPSILLGGGQSPHEAFGRIVGVSMLSGGRIAVADASIQQVLVFDSSGRLAFRWGRPGSGPGEFRNLAGISVAAESLFAFETAPGPSKYHARHLDDGTFAQGALRDSAGRLRVLGRFGSGAFLVSRDGFRAVSPPPLETVQRDTIDIGVFDPLLGSVDWIGPVPNNSWTSYRLAGTDRLAMTRLPLGASLAVVALGDLIWIGDTGNGAIRVVSAEGETLREFTAQVERRELDGQRRAELRRVAMESVRDELMKARVEAQYSDDVLPQLEPAFSRFVVSRDSLVWVVSRGAKLDSSEASVLTRLGERLARVSLPPHFVLWDADRDFVAGVRTDSTGAETVVVYRLLRSDR